MPNFITIKGVSLFREVLLDIGEELVAEDRLNNKQDIFFVKFEDIDSEEDFNNWCCKNVKCIERR